jgi:glycosyltransferase involved in cell wall biosynthesis
MKVLQVLPALESGGVERGTVEFAAELVKRGHSSHVCSNGGGMVAQLERQGSHHHQRPIHRKSLTSLTQIRPFRQFLRELRPDIIHVRSRLPAWINYLAWKGLPVSDRPALVSTFHGLYSVNPYSAIMARADQVIAVSNCVRDYALANYSLKPENLTVIHRGVDSAAFHPQSPDSSLFREYPALADRQLILMPGRLSRWKGQLQFLDVMRQIVRQQPNAHGLIVGGAESGKGRFLEELKQRCNDLGLEHHVTLLGARIDMAALYRLARVVCHLSTKAEPFGRTVTEALASGTPVVGFNRGGVAETLHACFPEGVVPADNIDAFVRKTLAVMAQDDHPIEVPLRFHLQAQVDATLEVYGKLLASGQQSDA